jgi:tetratricopeptide (TPR) repeat protein
MKKKYTYLIVIFLIVASFIVYSRILNNDFVNFDDNEYITVNNHIKSGINQESIKWAFSAVVGGNWHPLTLLSHTVDWSLFGTNASGHHLINLLLHIGSVLFLFFFLNKMTKNLWCSAFAAALFALHPLRVESVAWAAERKDVLSTFFGIASIYAYACYAENSKLSKYFLCLMLFALSLMAKPMLVTLPFVLLLLDYWPLRRWEEEISAPIKSRSHLIGRLLWEKMPFIFLTIISSIVTFEIQNKGGAVTSIEHLPFLERILNAVISYVSYLGKIFRPVDLAVFYPYKHSFLLWQVLVSCFILIGITIFVIYAIKKLPFLFVGWFWYLGTLIPVIGLVQVGWQATADRYTYFPSIGIAIMLAWGIPFLFPREDMRKKILFPAGIACLTILAVLTWRQCGYWKNSIELWTHTLQVTKKNVMAHNNRGTAYHKLGQYQLAIEDYDKAIRMKPDYVEAYFNRGAAYGELGQYQMAIEDFNKAIRMKPDYVEAYYNRGTIYNKLGKYQLAIEDFNKAIHLKQDYADAYNSRGTIYYNLGQKQLAIEDFNKAIRLKPDFALAYNNRGTIYSDLGQYQRAIEDYNKAIRLKPDYADTYYNRGTIYNKLGKYQLAIEDFNKAIRLKSDYVLAYYNRGTIYGALSQYQRAIEDLNKAIHLKPDYADAYYNKGTIYYNLGHKQRAIEDFNKAIRLKQDYANAYYSRGTIYGDLGQYQRAIEDYNKAIHLKPNYADAYYNRGNAYAKLGQQQLAIEDFNKAIHLKSDYVLAYYNRGTIYSELGQYQHTIEDLNKAIRLKPDYADAYYNRGTACGVLGQYPQAIEDFNRTIRLKPDYADAYNNRGFVYLNQGNNKLGCLDAQKACELGNCKTLEAAKSNGYCR